MAVIIRNMEIPKCCNECQFYDVDMYDYCLAAKKIMDDFEDGYSMGLGVQCTERRSSVCPLFPLDYDLLERKLDDGR